MNIEIEFRGKRLDNGKWLYGDLMHDNQGGCYIYPLDAENLYTENKVAPDTVGQFTGLVDKNGVKIFEGDILECVSWNEFWSVDGKPLEQLRRRLMVGHRNGSFVCIERQQAPFDNKVWDIISNHDCIIIGNIYDNHELLATK